MLKEDQTAMTMANSSEAMSSGTERAWQAVWKIRVPPKVRVFWWRILHNSLPSKAELKRRHVEKESHCEVCGDPDETLYHIIFSCTVARKFWGEVKNLQGVVIPSVHPCSWATDILQSEVCSASLAALIICGAWVLWTGRNGRRHGRKAWAPEASARYIASLLQELAALKMPTQPDRARTSVQWQRPALDWAKVNTDAGFSEDHNSRAGIVIRDQEGSVLAAAARWFEDVPDVLTAEALAAKEGLELAAELGYNRVILECDCQGEDAAWGPFQ